MTIKYSPNARNKIRSRWEKFAPAYNLFFHVVQITILATAKITRNTTRFSPWYGSKTLSMTELTLSSLSCLEEVVSQAVQKVGVPQLLRYTTFGLLNISITFSNTHLVFNFAVPMVWREPGNHADDCYFCLTNITGFNASSRKKIKYPNLRSAMRPVPHSDDLPVPTPPVNKDLLSSSREDSAASISLEDTESTYSETSGNEPHWITKEDLNDLARDLYLSKLQSELLASRLKQWNLVQEDVRITSFRNRNKNLASFFDMENKLCYCTNILGLFTSLGLPHNPSDWRLFIDSSKRSLKGVLLHNGNKYPSIPIAHCPSNGVLSQYGASFRSY